MIGIPDEKWGEAVTAIVDLEAGAELDTDDLVATVRDTLGGVRVPKSIRVVDTLPRSSTGKVLMRVLHEFWKGRDRVV